MPQAPSNGITLEYETFGDPADPAVLLVMGFAYQLTRWPVSLCEALVGRGFHVIRFDNRDVGLSAKMDALGPPDMAAIGTALAAGKPAPAPYSLDDMAADAVGLLDHLGIDKAHIVGASMGGMIAQLIAADYPDRVLSLTSIMSTTGAAELPRASNEVLMALMAPPPTEEAAVVERGIHMAGLIGSPAYRTDEAILRDRIANDFRRSFHPPGPARQLAAVLTAPDRREKLKRVTVPTVVLHGADDALVPVTGGHDTAAHVPDAELRIIDGMGHDFPEALVATFADAIEAAARRASRPT